MDDTISRAKVMDAVEDAADTAFVSFGDEEYVSVDELKKQLLALPSAQPEERTNKRTETHACDLIDRQAAIDALHMHLMYRMGTDSNKKRLDDWINNLPSAQPERKKGEWKATYSDCGGDVWVSWKCSNCGYVRKKGWEHTDDGEKPDALFCEMCNADMRGGQNG